MNSTEKEFTGRHMLAIMLAFFGVIIAVNVTMAMFARASWTGLVVKNSYVASQEFNEKAAEERAQAALAYVPTLRIDGDAISYAIADKDGRRIVIAAASASFHRPVTTREDTHVAFTIGHDGTARGTEDLTDGVWIMELTADIGREHPWRDMRRIVIRDGELK
ncbi:MAG: FixH family protein [Mesorhizobium sp.]|nr:FixH family protein [Mesorhizobium sp.]MCO5160627.1 FixH family protein [Mesorhizobium sp.]